MRVLQIKFIVDFMICAIGLALIRDVLQNGIGISIRIIGISEAGVEAVIFIEFSDIKQAMVGIEDIGASTILARVGGLCNAVFKKRNGTERFVCVRSRILNFYITFKTDGVFWIDVKIDSQGVVVEDLFNMSIFGRGGGCCFVDDKSVGILFAIDPWKVEIILVSAVFTI